jgi:SAM-dependent methyltransferase
MAVLSVGVSTPDTLKESPYSSHALLLDEFPPQGEGRRVLDIGCGYGFLGEFLARRGFAVTGVDRHGTAHSPDVEFIPADLDSGLPATGERFDFILCADVLEHLREPERMLRECRRRLKPGGVLIASLPNSAHAYVRWNVLLGRFPKHDRGLFDRTHLHFFSWQGWKELLETAGLAIAGVRVSGVPVRLAFPQHGDSWLMRAAERLSYESARAWKSLFAYQFIVRAHGRE